MKHPENFPFNRAGNVCIHSKQAPSFVLILFGIKGEKFGKVCRNHCKLIVIHQGLAPKACEQRWLTQTWFYNQKTGILRLVWDGGEVMVEKKIQKFKTFDQNSKFRPPSARQCTGTYARFGNRASPFIGKSSNLLENSPALHPHACCLDIAWSKYTKRWHNRCSLCRLRLRFRVPMCIKHQQTDRRRAVVAGHVGLPLPSCFLGSGGHAAGL